MGMMVQGLSPGVEHCDQADLGAEVRGIGRDGAQGLGGGPHQDVIDHRLVVECDLAQLCREREHHVEIGRRQQLGVARLEPFGARQVQAFGAVPVAAGIIGDAGLAARAACSTWPPSAAVRHAAMALITRRSTPPMCAPWACR